MEIITIKNPHGGDFGKGVLVEHEFYEEAGDFGTAVSLHFGKPYVGTYGHGTPVFGQERRHLQVWHVTWDGDGWIGETKTFHGNNYIAEPEEFAEAVEFALQNGLDYE